MDNILANFLAGGPRCPLCKVPLWDLDDQKPPYWALCRTCGGIFSRDGDGSVRTLKRQEREQARDYLQSDGLDHVRAAHERAVARLIG